jgi:hypothetical protein
MTETLDERIRYYESPTYAIAKTIKDKGYQIADSTGMRVSEPPNHVLGILEPKEPIEKSFLGFKWKRKQRALHIGTLWLANDARGAKPDENWVLEVYGRNNVPKLTELVREFSEPKKVSVQVRLHSEQPRVETYWSDYYDF